MIEKVKDDVEGQDEAGNEPQSPYQHGIDTEIRSPRGVVTELVYPYPAEPPTRDNSMTQPTNLILFMADNHFRDYAGCYGHPVAQTPTIDRIAALPFDAHANR